MLTPRRAVALVAALCVAAVAGAIAASRLAVRFHPGLTTPPPDTFAPLHLPRIDFHQHLAPGTARIALQVADRQGLSAVVNVSGGFGATLEAALADARGAGPRLLVFAALDPAGCCDAAWASREAGRLTRARRAGIRGLTVEPPLLATPDALEPVWEACAELGLPVLLHDDLAAANPRPELLRLIERHPRVTFVAPSLAGGGADPGALARLLDRLPNLWVDTTGPVAELGRDPEAVRAAILAHADRVLFATELGYVRDEERQGVVLGWGQPILLDAELLGGAERRAYVDARLRFLETRDPDLRDPDEPPGAGVSGIGLPREALRRVYHLNAERLLGVRAEDLAR